MSGRPKGFPDDRRLQLALCLGLLIVLAGCVSGSSGGSSPQEEPVTLGLINSANVTQSFDVRVVAVPGNVTLLLSDGAEETVEVGSAGGITRHPGYRTYTAVEYPESSRLHGRYTLAPGEWNQSEITEFPSDFAVVVTIHYDGRIIALASSHCEGTLRYVEVTSRYNGSITGRNCQ